MLYAGSMDVSELCWYLACRLLSLSRRWSTVTEKLSVPMLYAGSVDVSELCWYLAATLRDLRSGEPKLVRSWVRVAEVLSSTSNLARRSVSPLRAWRKRSATSCRGRSRPCGTRTSGRPRPGRSACRRRPSCRSPRSCLLRDPIPEGGVVGLQAEGVGVIHAQLGGHARGHVRAVRHHRHGHHVQLHPARLRDRLRLLAPRNGWRPAPPAPAPARPPA